MIYDIHILLIVPGTNIDMLNTFNGSDYSYKAGKPLNINGRNITVHISAINFITISMAATLDPLKVNQVVLYERPDTNDEGQIDRGAELISSIFKELIPHTYLVSTCNTSPSEEIVPLEKIQEIARKHQFIDAFKVNITDPSEVDVLIKKVVLPLIPPLIVQSFQSPKEIEAPKDLKTRKVQVFDVEKSYLDIFISFFTALFSCFGIFERSKPEKYALNVNDF